MSERTAPARAAEERAAKCAITWRRDWNGWLFSFRTGKPQGLDFVPGQFVRLGIPGADGAVVWRAYSIASPPDADHLEFYSIVVPDGPFTQPLSRCGVGDIVLVDPTVYGFLRTDRFDGGRHLWLLATGTGIAPFRAMIGDGGLLARFDQVVVVHSARQANELAYRDDLERWAAGGGGRYYRPTLTGASPMASDDDEPIALRGRITTLLAAGDLERSTGFSIGPIDSRVMLCGNPSMIREARALLGHRGLGPVRRDTPGHFIAENFW